jgi:hypothetical protein
MMIQCVVHFYRTILGVPFSLPQGSIHIAAAKNEARAVEAAKRRFARRRGVASWKLGADSFDVVGLYATHMRNGDALHSS